MMDSLFYYTLNKTFPILPLFCRSRPRQFVIHAKNLTGNPLVNSNIVFVLLGLVNYADCRRCLWHSLLRAVNASRDKPTLCEHFDYSRLSVLRASFVIHGQQESSAFAVVSVFFCNFLLFSVFP